MGEWRQTVLVREAGGGNRNDPISHHSQWEFVLPVSATLGSAVFEVLVIIEEMLPPGSQKKSH